jgi:hypothetical protein
MGIIITVANQEGGFGKEEKPTAPSVKLTVKIPERLHTRIKIDCATRRVSMEAAIVEMLEKRYGKD